MGPASTRSQLAGQAVEGEGGQDRAAGDVALRVVAVEAQRPQGREAQHMGADDRLTGHAAQLFQGRWDAAETKD